MLKQSRLGKQLIDTLGLDSMAVIELLYHLEETFGLPLILWTPSRHNCQREVRDGQTATEFHPRV